MEYHERTSDACRSITMPEATSLDIWRERLQCNGHLVTESPRPTETGFSLWARPDEIITVAMRDCYLADADAKEVYLAHGHDKVVVSIPDEEARKLLLEEFAGASWVFTDVSGYGSSMDEGGDAAEEADS
jgi:hypothetical protein